MTNFHDPFHEFSLINLLSIKLLNACVYARDPWFWTLYVILQLGRYSSFIFNTVKNLFYLFCAGSNEALFSLYILNKKYMNYWMS